METFLIRAAQLIVSLAFLVFIHELGHYIFARVFGIKVNRFYLFFNPWFSLLKYYPDKGRVEVIAWSKTETVTKPDGTKTEEEKPCSLLSFKVGRGFSPVNKKGRPSWAATLYGLGWLPLGGYCDIAGMIDETKSASDLASEPQPWEFRSKPAVQRLLVMCGGVLFNFILAILIYAGIAWHWGDKYIDFDKAYEGMDFAPEAQAIGFRNGDILLSADDEPLSAADQDYAYRMVEADVVKVLRNHRDTVEVRIPDDFIFRLNKDNGFLAYRVPVYVDKTLPGSAAREAGMEEGDRIVRVDTFATPSFTELTPALESVGGRTVEVDVMRDGKLLTLSATPTEGGKLGFQLKPITDIYPTVTKHYTFFRSIPKGWEIGTTTLGNYVGSMKHVFTREGAQSIGGFGAIGSMFPEHWNWYTFWQITAFLSVALAFMNILPIPALDGGHVLFLICEVITRRKPSEKLLGYAQTVGMAFLLLLLVYANGNDLIRYLKDLF